MIYLIYGNDNIKKSANIKEIADGASIVRIPIDQITNNALLTLAKQSDLFGNTPTTVIENAITGDENIFNDDILKSLKESINVFIFLEDTLTQVQIKKYKKYLEDTILCEKKEISKPKVNAFVIADMFGKRDKVGTWTTYLDLVEKGEAPEAISGMLFWKIKTLLLARSVKPYSKRELELASSQLVDIYHKAHAGDTDMKVALEQFILSTI
ncbi:hypothetical protein IT400_01550 [Candidatus Nomurabacteria bacterium]|nr:hypothetical protein [Candidatus Nomurabacteria bacterium]